MSETDNTASSRAVEAVYDGVLNSLLRAYRWSFAIRRAELAKLTDAPVYGYQYQYPLPADCVRIDKITDRTFGDWRPEWNHPVPQYQIEGSRILTDMESPVYLRYVARITDPAQYDESFTEAFACALAVEVCESITQSSTKKQAAQQDMELAVRTARQVSAIERPPIQQQETSWYTSRL